MKSIIFINPAAAKEAELKIWSSGVMNKLMDNFMSIVPKTTGMIFAAITPQQYDFKYLDEDIEEIDFNAKADLVAITAMTVQATRAYEIADRFRKSGVPVVMGGIHATILPDEVGIHCDAVMVGEGENTWPVMLKDLERGTLKKVYAAKDYPPVTEFVKPRTDAIRGDRYTMHPIQATRGCPYDCDFCSTRFSTGKVYRMKPVQQVIDEIKEFEKDKKNKIGPYKKGYMFIDDNLYVNREYIKELFTAMKGLNISWSAQGTINTAFDDEILSLMAESGCKLYGIGFESLSEETLKDSNKPKFNKTEDYATAIENLIRHGIVPGGYFIFGFDNDDISVFQKTVDFAINSHLMHPLFTVLTPYPGTRVYDRIEAEGRIVDREWKNYNSAECVFTPKKMSKATLEAGMVWASKRLADIEVIKNQFKYYWGKGPWPHVKTLNFSERAVLFGLGLWLLHYDVKYTKFLFWVIRQKNASDIGSIFAALSLHDTAMSLSSSESFQGAN